MYESMLREIRMKTNSKIRIESFDSTINSLFHSTSIDLASPNLEWHCRVKKIKINKNFINIENSSCRMLNNVYTLLLFFTQVYLCLRIF